MFPIPAAGSWTVTATRGTDTKSQTIEITTYGQTESIKLEYWNGELYNAGNEYNAITGGWTVHPNATRNSDSIKVVSGASYSRIFSATSRRIDLTEFTTLYINCTAASSTDSAAPGNLGAYNLDNPWDVYTVHPSSSVNLSQGQKSLNISGFTGSYIIGVCCPGTSGISRSVTFNKVWLK